MSLRGLRQRIERMTAKRGARPYQPSVLVFDFDDDPPKHAQAEAEITKAKADGRTVLVVHFVGSLRDRDSGVMVELTDEHGNRALMPCEEVS